PKLVGPSIGWTGGEDNWNPVPHRAPSSGIPESCGPAAWTRRASAMLVPERIGGPSTPETQAAYRRARDSGVLIPFAPGISAAWMSGSLNETIPSLAGNANAPPIDTLRATIGLSA